jgi:hypothetical protein
MKGLSIISIIQIVHNEKTSVIKIYSGVDEIATATMILADGQIQITTVNVKEELQGHGYGRLLFTSIFFLAQKNKLPLYVRSITTAIEFYEKVGFLHLDEPEVQKMVNFGLRSEQPFYQYPHDRFLSKRELECNPFEVVDRNDMVWIPKGLKIKPTIYIEVRRYWRKYTKGIKRFSRP